MTDVFGGLLASFQLALEAEGKSPKTVENYSRAVEQFAAWLSDSSHTPRAGNLDIRDVRADDIRAWLVSQRGKVAASTAYRNYSGLRQFLKWAVAEDELDVSPMANIRPPAVPEPRTEILTDDQLRALLADCQGKDFVARRDTAIILLFADSGMRRAELAALTVDDLDLRARVAYVTGKGRRPRTVPYGVRTAQSLDRYLRLRRAHPRAAQPALWLAEKARGVLTADGIRQMLERRGRNIGVKLHAHAFRHRFADAFLRAGGTPQDLQELAGWRSPQMVRRYGAINRAERARQAYRRLSPMDSL